MQIAVGPKHLKLNSRKMQDILKIFYVRTTKWSKEGVKVK